MRACGARAGDAAAALDGDDGLRSSDPLRSLEESSRVPDGLQVEQDDPGPWIGLPVLEQVFPGHVGLVAEADEVANSDAMLAGPIEQGGPQRPRLGSDGHIACCRPGRGERGVKSDLGIRVEDAEAVRADDPKGRSASRTEQMLLGIRSRRPGLAEPRGDDHGCLCPRGRALLEDRGDSRRRDGDDGEIDGLRELRDAGIRANPLYFPRARVDRVDRSRERSAHEVGEDLAADRSARPRRSHDGNGLRPQERFERGPHRNA